MSVLIYQFLIEIVLPDWLLNEVPKVLEEEFVEDFRQRMNEEPSSAFFTKGQVSLDSVQAIGRDSYTFENLNLEQRLDMIEQRAIFGELLSFTMPIRVCGSATKLSGPVFCTWYQTKCCFTGFPKAQLWGIEKDSQRYAATIKRLRQNTRVARELHRLNFINEDALHWMEQMDPESMDFILLDAPCSALGTILNHPEFLSLKESQSFDHLPDLQFELLSKALNLLKPGGQIIYSVCTFRSEESEMIIKRCVEQHKNIHLADDSSILGEKVFRGDYGQYIWGLEGEPINCFIFREY